MEILTLLKQMEEVLDNAKYLQLGKISIGLDHEELIMLMNQVRACLPEELRKASKVTKESETILEAARRDAEQMVANGRSQASQIVQEAEAERDQIIAEGRAEAARLVERHEVTLVARQQAEEMLRQAEHEAAQRRDDADRYALEVLQRLEDVLQRNLITVQKGRDALTQMR